MHSLVRFFRSISTPVSSLLTPVNLATPALGIEPVEDTGDLETPAHTSAIGLTDYKRRSFVVQDVAIGRVSLGAYPQISTFPAELLSEIFGYCLWTCVTACLGKRCRYPHLEVSQVCRHWRAIALNSAILWSTFETSRYDMASAMVTRSKSAPLSVRLFLQRCEKHVQYTDRTYLRKEPAGPILRSVLCASKHIRSLHAEFGCCDSLEVFENLQQSRYPSLQSLSLSSCSQYRDVEVVLPDDLIGRVPTSLRALVLDGVSLGGTTMISQNLKKIHLSNGRASPVQFVEIFAAFANLPVLEDLHISEYRMPRGSETTPSDGARVHLSQLRHFRVDEICQWLSPYILLLFTVPESTIEDIRMDDLSEGEDLNMLGSVLCTRASRATDVPKRLAILIDGDFADEAIDDEDYADAPVSVGLWYNGEGIGPPSISLPWICKVDGFGALITGIGEQILARHLQVVEISGVGPSLARWWWAETLARLISVHTLILGVSHAAADCLENLAYGEETVAPMLPLLRVLVIQTTAIFPPISDHWSSWPEEEGEFWTDSICTLLHDRHSKGAALDQLRVEGCPWIDVGFLQKDKINVVIDEVLPTSVDPARWRYRYGDRQECS